MPDDKCLRPEEIAHQVKQHLASLMAAGLEWVPESPHSVPALARTSEQKATQAPKPTRTPPLDFDGPQLSPAELLLPPEERRQELTVLAKRVAECTRCKELSSGRTQTVFGVGAIDAELCFVGEAPGFSEDKKGEPFVGDAGQLLNRIIAACGMKREEVYICNIVKCRPPGNRLPLADESANCQEYLTRQLDLIRPKFICALGACAAQNLLDSTLPIGRLRGRFHQYRGIPVLCTYHPAYLLRTPEKKKDVWEDMKTLLARMGRTVPGP